MGRVPYPSWSSGSRCSRPTVLDAASPDLARRGRGPRPGARSRSRSTPTSRPAAAPRRRPATPSCAEEYRRSLDPFVALRRRGPVTSTIRLGTGICVVAPARADRHRQGHRHARPALGRSLRLRHRLRLEQRGDGEPRRRRCRPVASRVREHVLAMQAIWADDVASFDGELVQFERAWSWPKPAQTGGPPVLLGGSPGPKLFAHIAEYGDGWIPIGGAGVKDALPDLHRACEAVGRDPAEIRIVPFGTLPVPGQARVLRVDRHRGDRAPGPDGRRRHGAPRPRRARGAARRVQPKRSMIVTLA